MGRVACRLAGVGHSRRDVESPSDRRESVRRHELVVVRARDWMRRGGRVVLGWAHLGALELEDDRVAVARARAVEVALFVEAIGAVLRGDVDRVAVVLGVDGACEGRHALEGEGVAVVGEKDVERGVVGSVAEAFDRVDALLGREAAEVLAIVGGRGRAGRERRQRREDGEVRPREAHRFESTLRRRLRRAVRALESSTRLFEVEPANTLRFEFEQGIVRGRDAATRRVRGRTARRLALMARRSGQASRPRHQRRGVDLHQRFDRLRVPSVGECGVVEPLCAIHGFGSGSVMA